jgi:hypothetical protein
MVGNFSLHSVASSNYTASFKSLAARNATFLLALILIALCAPLLQRMQSTPQQSPSILLCLFPMLAAPNGSILPRIA